MGGKGVEKSWRAFEVAGSKLPSATGVLDVWAEVVTFRHLNNANYLYIENSQIHICKKQSSHTNLPHFFIDVKILLHLNHLYYGI